MDERFFDIDTSGATDAIFAIQVCRALSEHTRDIVLLMTGEGDIVFANSAARISYQLTSDALTCLNIRELRAPHTVDAVTEQMQVAATSGSLLETEHVRTDGSVFPVEVSSRGVTIAGRSYLLSIIRDITARCAREAERESLLEDLTAANHQLAGLLRIVSSAVGSLDMEKLLEEVLVALREVMSADAALFFKFENGVLVLEAQQGYPEGTMSGLTLREGEGFASLVAAAGEELWSPDVTSTEAELSVHHEFGIRAMFGMPLYVDGGLFGVLECTWSTERLVSDTERVMLQVASDRIVAAMSGVRRHEGARRARVLESALTEAASTLASSHEIAMTVPAALEIMAVALGCHVACFGTWEEDVFNVLHAYGTQPRHVLVPPLPVEREHTVVEDFSARINQPGTSGAWLREEFGIDSALVVPVLVRGDARWTVLFGNRTSDIVLDDMVVEYGRRMSQSLAIAYGNARDYESEHRIAETLQEALLSLDGQVAGVRYGHLYRSSTLATRVGGDFYDIFELRDGLVGVLVGDVSGKGLDAAVLTTVVKHTIRAFAHEAVSPSEILFRANEALAATSRLRDFATVALVIIDPRSGEGRYCGAGHPPGLVVRAQGGAESLCCGSPVLGAFTGLEFFECAVTLGQGDTLVLYTDGVTEARCPSGGFFGEERLVAAVDDARGMAAEDLAGHIGVIVTGFTEGRLTDDVAVVTLSLCPSC